MASNQNDVFSMDTANRSKVISLFPNDSDEESSNAGWDPYIFSIVADAHRPYKEDRRRSPRVNTPLGRRALLLSKGKRRKKS